MTKDEALRLASVVLDHCYGHHAVNDNMIELTAKVIQAALEAKDEPYAFEASMYSNDRMKVDPVTGNVSIGTPQRTWVGLTEAECGVLWKVDMTPFDYYQAIEAKLRQKNT
jgi:hypothetical protein